MNVQSCHDEDEWNNETMSSQLFVPTFLIHFFAIIINATAFGTSSVLNVNPSSWFDWLYSNPTGYLLDSSIGYLLPKEPQDSSLDSLQFEIAMIHWHF